MVQNTRETSSTNRVHALNQPNLIQVEEIENHKPLRIKLHHQNRRVVSIEDIWEIVDGWWRVSPTNRRYYRLNLEGEVMITIFRDLTSNLWYQQRVQL